MKRDKKNMEFCILVVYKKLSKFIIVVLISRNVWVRIVFIVVLWVVGDLGFVEVW